MTTIGAAYQVDATAGVPLPGGCNSRAQRNALYLRRGLEFEEWAEIGRRIATITDSAAWWIGDWLAFGRRFYPGRYKAALAMNRARLPDLAQLRLGRLAIPSASA